jgi:hypothetical protein
LSAHVIKDRLRGLQNVRLRFDRRSLEGKAKRMGPGAQLVQFLMHRVIQRPRKPPPRQRLAQIPAFAFKIGKPVFARRAQNAGHFERGGKVYPCLRDIQDDPHLLPLGIA